MLPHSEAKVSLLEKYLEAFLAVIANDNFTKAIHAFDLFAGEGIYPNGKAGSSVTIARQFMRLKQARSNAESCPDLYLYFNDRNQAKVDSTLEALEGNGIGEDSGIAISPTCDKYENILPNVVSKVDSLGDEKSFIFIDPYGYKAVKPQDISRLLKGGKSEVLLFQPTQFLFRFTQSGTPKALSDFTAELGQGKKWPENLDIWGYVNHVRYLFSEYVGKNYFVDIFTIQKDPSTVFCLFFFTSHIRGFEKMLDTKWKLNESTGRGWHFEQYGDTLDLFHTPQINPLQNILIESLNEYPLSNGEAYELTLRSGFRPTHCVEVLKSLQNQGKIEVTLSDGKKARKGSFYINYENFKKRPARVLIKIA